MEKTLNSRIQEFFDNVKDYVLLPDMNQTHGYFYEGGVHGEPGDEHGSNCCFGARVARGISEPEVIMHPGTDQEYSRWDFSDGEEDMMEFLEVSERELTFMLWVCGASVCAFGSRNWDRPVEEVMKRFVQIENRPLDLDIKVFYHHCANLEGSWPEHEKEMFRQAKFTQLCQYRPT